jgi:ABC-type branched-subunit amino acid transport system substrate-binding protein
MSENSSSNSQSTEQTNSRRSFLKAAGGSVAVASSLSGCALFGGGSGSSAFKVGAQMPLSGVYETRGTPMMNATQLAVQRVNDNGGIDGRDVELVTRDNQSDPNTGVEQARELTLEEGVNVTFGGMASSMRNAVLPIHVDNEVPYFYATSYEGGVCQEIGGVEEFIDGINIPKDLLEWGFFSGAVPSQELDPFVSYLTENVQSDSWFLVGADYLWPHAMHSVLKDFLSDAGVNVVGETYAPPANENWESTISDIQSADPDMVYMSLNAGAVPFMNQAASLGLTDQAEFASSAMTTPLAGAIGEPADGVYGSNDWFTSVDNEASNRFMEDYQNEYGSEATPSNYAESCYFQVLMTAQALRDNAPDASSGADVKEALEQSPSYDAPQGTVEMDPSTHHCFLNPRVGQYDADAGSFEVLQTRENVAPYGTTVQQDCL